MTTSTPPAIVQADTRLENELLVLQLVDDLETRFILTRGGWENDPIARPFTHSLATEVGASLLLNAAIRAIPASRFKVATLRVVIGVWAVNDALNARVMVRISQ